MTPAEMQSMMAAVRACVGSVEDMADIVLALPADLAKQLGEIRGIVQQSIAAIGTRLDASEAKVAEDLSRIALSGQQLSDTVGRSLAEHSTIIADNRVVVEALGKKLEDTTLGFGEVLTNLNTMVGKTGESIRSINDSMFQTNAKVGEIMPAVELLVEGSIKAHSITAEQITSVSLRELSDNLRKDLAGDKQYVLEQLGELAAAQSVQLSAAVEGVESALTERIGANATRLEELAEQQREFATVTVPSVMGVTQTAIETDIAHRVKAVEDSVQAALQDVGERIGTVALAHEALAQKQQADVEKTVRNIEGRTETMDNKLVDMREFVVAELQTAGEARDSGLQVLTERLQDVAVVAERADTGYATLERRIESYKDNVGTDLEGFRVELQADRETTAKAIEVVAKELPVVTEKLLTEVRNVHEKATNIDSRVDDAVLNIKAVSDLLQDTETALRESMESTQAVARQHFEGTLSSVTSSYAALEKNVGKVETEIETVAKSIDQVRTATADALEVAGNTIEERIETSIRLTNERLLALDESIVARTAEIGDTLRKEFDDALTESDDTRDGLFKAAVEAAEAIGKTQADMGGVLGEISERATAVAESFNTAVAEIRGQVEAVHKLADSRATPEQLVEAAKLLGERIEDANERAEKAVQAIGEVQKSTAAIAADFKEQVKVVKTLAESRATPEQLGEAAKTLGERIEDTNQLVETTAGELRKGLEAITGQVEAVHKLADERATPEQLVEATKLLGERIEGSNETVSTIRELANETAKRVGALSSELEEKADGELLNKTLTEIVERVAVVEDARNELGVTLKSVRGEVEEAKQSVSEFSGFVGELIEGVRKEMADLVTPVQLAEFETKVMSQLPGEPAPIELPAPSLDVQMRDSVLHVKMAFGDAERTVEIPVDIGMRYRGTYKEGERYKAGDFVTSKGSGWVANKGQTGVPGVDTTGWTLAIKRGADGRSVKSYESHNEGTRYGQGDFLRHNNLLWQATATTVKVPEGSVRESTPEWTLIGAVQ